MVQQVPSCNPSSSFNTSASHYSNSSGVLNVSASSFNLDSSLAEGGETSYTGVGNKDHADASSSSLANLSGGSISSGSRNDSGIGIGGGSSGDPQKKVMLQLNNLDSSYDETALKKFLVSLLKPIAPIVSLLIDGPSSAKIEVPSPHVS